MKRVLALVLAALLPALSGCGGQRDLIDMKSISMDGKRATVWEDRIYVPFCVVSKNDRGKQIGYFIALLFVG